MATRLTFDLDQATFIDLWSFVDALCARGTPPDRRVELVDSSVGSARSAFRLEVLLSESHAAGPGHWHQPGVRPPGVPAGSRAWAPERVGYDRPPEPGGLVIHGSTATGSWRRDLPAEIVERWQAALREVLAVPLADSTREALTSLLDALTAPVPPHAGFAPWVRRDSDDGR